jgi:dUTP pyrophosphatase
MDLRVPIARLPHAEGLPLPAYATPGAAGLDLVAAIDGDRLLPPGGRTLVPSGIAIALPRGWEGQVRSRSGLALRQGVAVLNAPGTVDSDYRGEIGVVLINHGEAPVTLSRGMRIAQLVVAPCGAVTWDERPDLDETARGTGGFGSTGAEG